MPYTVGVDVVDKTGNNHLGIIEFPIPILKGNSELLKRLREKLYQPEFSEFTVADFMMLPKAAIHIKSLQRRLGMYLHADYNILVWQFAEIKN